MLVTLHASGPTSLRLSVAILSSPSGMARVQFANASAVDCVVTNAVQTGAIYKCRKKWLINKFCCKNVVHASCFSTNYFKDFHHTTRNLSAWKWFPAFSERSTLVKQSKACTTFL